MRKGVSLLFMLALAAAHPDTLLPEGCGLLAEKGFLDTNGLASCDFIGTAGSPENQRAMMGALVYPSIGYVDGDFLHTWNTAWKYDAAPVDADPAPYNGPKCGGRDIIENAWMEIVAITPSVRDMQTGNILAPSHGEVQTELNYTFQKGYWNNKGGKSCADCSMQECKMEGSSAYLDIGMRNGNLIGQTSSSDPAMLTRNPIPYGNGAGSMEFDAELTLGAKWERIVWRRVYACGCGPCAGEDDSCCYGCCGCFPGDPQKNDIEHRISDARAADAYQYGFHVFQVMDSPNRAIVHVFSLAPMNNFDIYLGSAHYSKSAWGYGLEYEHPPYNAMKGVASETSPTEEFDGMLVEKRLDSDDGREALKRFMDQENYNREVVDPRGTGARLLAMASDYPIYHTELRLAVDNTRMGDDTCEMYISSHFERLKISGFCNTVSLPKTSLTIETDKGHYEMNEPVSATIRLESGGEPIAGKVHLKFRESSTDIWVDGEETVELIATMGGAIFASYDTDLLHSSASAAREVEVRHPEAWGNLEAILAVLFAWGAAYVVLKAFAKGVAR